MMRWKITEPEDAPKNDQGEALSDHSEEAPAGDDKEFVFLYPRYKKVSDIIYIFY